MMVVMCRFGLIPGVRGRSGITRLLSRWMTERAS